ncbi:MAG: hypothetical protein NVSMB25_16120 [Thermoleophilaceae bacterium]
MFYFANILQPLLDVNEAILKFWHTTVGLSWGASIIGLTVVIRLAILPLSYKQIRSMQAMQRLQPQMKKLQERYKDDKARQREELMKFYRDHSVNPLGSCLPLVFQLPFFFSLFYLQRSQHFKNEVRGGEKFFFIPDITKPLTHHAGVLAVMIVLYVGSQLASSLVSASSIQDKNQRRLMLALPIFFVFFVIRFPAGLLVYWITTNVWTVGQQLAVKRFLPAPPPHTAAEAAEVRETVKAGSTGNGGKATTPGKAKAAASSNGGPHKAPPGAPRKRKKRSGRRR